MVKIRLSRHGKKSHPAYWIVAAEHTSPRDGKFIEKIGYYQPTVPSTSVRCQIDEESFAKWMKNGAIPTERVAKLASNLDSLKLLVAKYIPKQIVRAPKKDNKS